jgi:hypothetical protein
MEAGHVTGEIVGTGVIVALNGASVSTVEIEGAIEAIVEPARWKSWLSTILKRR